MRGKTLFLFLWSLCLFSSPLHAQAPPPVVVFWEEGFPSADTVAPSRAELTSLLPEAFFASGRQLNETLGREETKLLVLPFGSVFPEPHWQSIYAFLKRGGNLLVLGGKPFTRPAYLEKEVWKLRPARLAFAKQLFINDYEATPGSTGLQFRANENFEFLDLPAFDWSRAYSLTIRLSDEDLYPREGSGGTYDARLDTLAWGTSNDRRLSAPLVQVDHWKNNFVGGRWILLACELAAGFYASPAARHLIPSLVLQALEGAEAFVVRPSWPLFLHGEPLTFQVYWLRFGVQPMPVRLEVELAPETGTPTRQSFDFEPGTFPFARQITLPPSQGKGLHVLTARLYAGGRPRGISRTGFWLRDLPFLRSGPQVSVNKDFFEIDGRQQPIVGTTYMASDVQREFFMSPNAYVWDRDMAELRRAGINMLRTGWWTAWTQVMKESGVVHEEMLRALEAYLMTARKHGLPVQFTFFSFIPEVLGGSNPYLDPEALRRQKELILAVVERFKDVPYLIWDLINQPSFSNPRRLWTTRPNRDEHELAAWNAWLEEKFADRGALAEAWKTILVPDEAPVPLPLDEEFSARAVYDTARGRNSVKAYDYYRFAQEEFRRWVEELRKFIRATGSRQPLTVGQDEGGGRDRLNPAFFADALDFTATHPWWQHDALLWDSLVAKQPGKAMLVQEAGVGRQIHIDESARRSPEERAALLARKLAIAMATGAGAIHWLWNINAYMRDDNEVAIGAVRADSTERPEAEAVRQLSEFAARSGSYFAQPEMPEVAIVTAQGFQYSALNWLALEAQMKAVRTLHYHCRVPGYVVAENQIARFGKPKLLILPSPHALGEQTWQALLKYVENGGNLLITGSMERDPRWNITQRLAALGVEATPEPLTYRQANLELTAETIALSFDGEKQQFLEALRTADGKTFHEMSRGKGRIFVAGYPVELAEGFAPAARLYDWVLSKVGIERPFEGALPSPGVLIRPTFFLDGVLYLFVSESGHDEEIALRDKSTGAEIRFHLPAERSRLVLISKKDSKVIAEYAF